ncbi:hypothetical protein SAMN02746089_00601 [Caldanaerobius fijiensis DSM 17918]|uniref:DUF4129 domain-containing protein n=1 Tax=Caldanaerobius fijiensis DSM 17918 TaxID=1121256 RepID=A0A1M4VDP6_9THEO|nr:hypothetical protein [Caldanaerobius fijiensis]SHE67101.1 hypothetical protein SAMN02746089_00601 [Caldanaerobius fijiensis DSM 17918]
MKKKSLLEVLYVIPEIIIAYLVLSKFYNTLNVAIYIMVIIYTFVIMQILYRKMTSPYFIIFLLLPAVVIMMTPLASFMELQTIAVIETIAILRFYLLFKNTMYLRYRNTSFISEAIVIIGVSLIFARGSLMVYYAILLKLILLIQSNVAHDVETKLGPRDVLFIIFNFILLIIVPIYSALSRGIYTIWNFIEAIILYPAYLIGLLLGKIPNLTPQQAEKMEQAMSNVDRMGKLLYRDGVKETANGNPIARIVVYILWSAVIGIIVYSVIRKFLHLEADKGEEQEYKQEVVSLKPEFGVRAAKLSPIRQMYRRILKMAIKDGYELKNSSTARDLNFFLYNFVSDKHILSKISDIYEKERYSMHKEGDYNEFLELFKDVMKQLN